MLSSRDFEETQRSHISFGETNGLSNLVPTSEEIALRELVEERSPFSGSSITKPWTRLQSIQHPCNRHTECFDEKCQQVRNESVKNDASLTFSPTLDVLYIFDL